MSMPDAGWYTDPTDPRMIRWWDGASWTPHVQPTPEEQPAPTTPDARAVPAAEDGQPRGWVDGLPPVSTDGSAAALEALRAMRAAQLAAQQPAHEPEQYLPVPSVRAGGAGSPLDGGASTVQAQRSADDQRPADVPRPADAPAARVRGRRSLFSSTSH